MSPELRDRPGGHHSRGQWASNFAGEQVESILRGGVCASSEMVGHVALSQEFFAPFVDAPPGVVRMGDCESLFPHLHNKDRRRGVPGELYCGNLTSSGQRCAG